MNLTSNWVNLLPAIDLSFPPAFHALAQLPVTHSFPLFITHRSETHQGAGHTPFRPSDQPAYQPSSQTADQRAWTAKANNSSSRRERLAGPRGAAPTGPPSCHPSPWRSRRTRTRNKRKVGSCRLRYPRHQEEQQQQEEGGGLRSNPAEHPLQRVGGRPCFCPPFRRWARRCPWGEAWRIKAAAAASPRPGRISVSAGTYDWLAKKST